MHYARQLSRDPRLKKLIREHGPVRLEKRKPLYLWLSFSIMSQQLSTQVARIIRQRFLDLYGGKEPGAQEILDTPFETLRAIGLSNAKTRYVQNVARFELDHGLSHKKLSAMSDAEAMDYLTQIKGVGKWTAEMLLMFALGREDIFAIDDLGLQQAVIGLYGLKHRNKNIMRARILEISGHWKPFRSYACLYLWKWKDSR